MTTSETQSLISKKPVERLIIWFTILATVGIVAAHLVFAIVRLLIPELSIAAWSITFGAIGLAAVFTLVYATHVEHTT